MSLVYDINDPVVMVEKHPSGRRNYIVNMASPDGTNDASTSDTGFLQSRTISSISVTTPSGITLESSSNTTTTFTLEASGGSNDTDYEFDIDVTLSTSEIEPVTVIIPVKDPGRN